MSIALLTLFLVTPHFVFAVTNQTDIQGIPINSMKNHQNQTGFLGSIVNAASMFKSWSWSEYYLFTSIIAGICIFGFAIGYVLSIYYHKKYRRRNYERIDMN